MARKNVHKSVAKNAKREEVVNFTATSDARFVAGFWAFLQPSRSAFVPAFAGVKAEVEFGGNFRV